MDSSRGNFKNSNYTYSSFPNVTEKQVDISEDNSLHNPVNHGTEESFEEEIIFDSFIAVLVISFIGALGNGAVIWLLGFRIKRNPFSTFILNLAVADFGVHLSAIIHIFLFFDLANLDIDLQVSYDLFLLMYSASQFLLTAISIDRCVAVFCPLWHRCKRPPRFSTIVCALIWVLSALLTGITCILQSVYPYETTIKHSYQFIVNAMVCLPIMTIATVALSRKACSKAGQHRRGRLLTLVLLTLLFFLLFAFPLNVISIAICFHYIPVYIDVSAFLLAGLNSSVNPVIYFLAGRQWKTRPKESLKMILQNVFKEDESREGETPV